jgi:hypothetical protein
MSVLQVYRSRPKNLISLSRLQFVCWRYCCTLVLPSSTNVLASVICKNFCTLCCIVYPTPYLSIHPLFLILFSHETTQCDEDYIITLGDLVDKLDQQRYIRRLVQCRLTFFSSEMCTIYVICNFQMKYLYQNRYER